jgi:hypothetical protein
MDNVNHLSVADTGIPGGATIDQIASDLAKGLKVNAKTKTAKKVADEGNYWTLTPYQKSLIAIPGYILNQVANQGITYFAVYQIDAQGIGSSQTQIVAGLKKISKNPNMLGVGGPAAKPAAQTEIIGSSAGVTDPAVKEIVEDTKSAATKSSLTTMLPYIIGAVVLGIIAYFLLKKKK